MPNHEPSGYDASTVTSGEYLPGRGTSALLIARRVMHLNYHDGWLATWDLRLATCTTARSETERQWRGRRWTMAQLSPEHETDMASGSSLAPKRDIEHRHRNRRQYENGDTLMKRRVACGSLQASSNSRGKHHTHSHASFRANRSSIR